MFFRLFSTKNRILNKKPYDFSLHAKQRDENLFELFLNLNFR